MNEKIKELIGQAFFDENTNQPSDKMYTFTEHKMKQFALLIVKECAQEAYDCAKQFRNDEHYRVDNLWPQFERVCNAVGDDIKIKFGVEE